MNENKNSYAVWIAVIAVVALIAGAFYYQKINPSNTNKSSFEQALNEIIPIEEGVNISALRPVDQTDKILGQAEAPVKIIVYSDLECPACKYFDQQLRLIDDQYIKTGKVAIVFRHFPLDSLHPINARNEAIASECVNELGGNEKFWQFINKIFDITPSNDRLDQNLLASTALEIGINQEDFKSCMDSKRHAESIQKSVDEAIALGAKGTPFSLIITPQNQILPFFGGYPAERIISAIDLILSENVEQTSTETATTTTENISVSTSSESIKIEIEDNI